jgi:hypothetical protein
MSEDSGDAMPVGEPYPYIYVNADGTARELHPANGSIWKPNSVLETARHRISRIVTRSAMAGATSQVASRDRDSPMLASRYMMLRKRIQLDLSTKKSTSHGSAVRAWRLPKKATALSPYRSRAAKYE